MISIRKSSDRGHFNHGWLDTYHSFSFGDYFDPENMGFRTLRVINEDVIAPGEGFPTHGHRDMEIITYILAGELAHQDSLGNRETIKTGELQRMTAGTGIRHSEFNASEKNPCHLLQIWILPEKKDLKPGYEQKIFQDTGKNLQLVVAPSTAESKENLVLNQDAKIYLGRMKKGETTSLPLTAGRYAWIQMIQGSLSVNGKNIEKGDGAAISEETKLDLECREKSEFLLFDLN